MKTFKSYCFTQDKIVNIDKKTAKKSDLTFPDILGGQAVVILCVILSIIRNN